MTKRLLFVVNCRSFFLVDQLPLALTTKQQDYEVHVATTAGEAVNKITASGLAYWHQRVILMLWRVPSSCCCKTLFVASLWASLWARHLRIYDELIGKVGV